MKFFDLEFDSRLLANVCHRTGGRDIVHENENQPGKCKKWVFHGGMNYNDCENSTWKKKEDCWVTSTIEFK